MPSGLLNGRGCYDSIRKSEDDSALFLSIRHQSMPFLLDEREAKAKLSTDASGSHDSIDARVREQFATGTLPILRSIAKFFSLIFVFPLHFLFKQLPDLIADKVVTPLMAVIKSVYERIAAPCIKVFYSVYNPIKAVCNKIQAAIARLIAAVKVPCVKFQKQVLALLQKVHVLVVLPPKRALEKVGRFIAGCNEQVQYRLLISKIWIRLLINHSLSSLPIIGKRK
jgi:hypothetical protein